MDYSLQVEHLCKSYDGFALQDVSFALPKGSVMGFIGENGAGKTTVIKAILGMIRRESGTIRLFGKEQSGDMLDAKQEIGVVFDGSNFHDPIRPVDIAAMMGKIYKNWDDALFQKYLAEFKIPAGKQFKEFSRGMKMKLSIATAISHHPKLLILDEATSGLDPIVRDEILDVFFDLIQDEERSILMSSHITSDLEKIADYITFIHEGHILLCEEKDRMLEDYRIIKCSREQAAAVAKEDIVRRRDNGFGCELMMKVGTAQNYRGLLMERPSLEDIMLFFVKGELA